MTSENFADLGVAEPIRRALTALDLTVPTPIQARAIPVLLEGRDILATAQTGTGKTAAFALPVMQMLAAARERPKPKSPRALVLAPTRELAGQIGKHIQGFGRHIGLRHAVIFGGVGQGPQVSALARGIDILIATPGRLRDLMNQNHVRLDQVRFLVLDEADRMLDMGFIRDVRKIVATLPKERQSLLLSATMPPDVAKLAAEMLTEPVRIDITPKAVAVERIDQHVFFVPFPAKRDLLTKLLDDPALSRVIVFTRTKRGADKVAEHLGRSRVAAEAIHGNKSQGARQRALEQFRSGKARVLVATDIAARGIDVNGVTHVINYELPNEPESYVHRIGRTARAGASGIAFSFCDPSERAYLRDIERLTRRPLSPRETGLPAAAMAAAPAAGRETTRGQSGGKVVEYPKGLAPRGPRAGDARRGRNGRPARGSGRRPDGPDRRRMDG